jgi:hypothetical protein
MDQYRFQNRRGDKLMFSYFFKNLATHATKNLPALNLTIFYVAPRAGQEIDISSTPSRAPFENHDRHF